MARRKSRSSSRLSFQRKRKSRKQKNKHKSKKRNRHKSIKKRGGMMRAPKSASAPAGTSGGPPESGKPQVIDPRVEILLRNPTSNAWLVAEEKLSPEEVKLFIAIEKIDNILRRESHVSRGPLGDFEGPPPPFGDKRGEGAAIDMIGEELEVEEDEAVRMAGWYLGVLERREKRRIEEEEARRQAHKNPFGDLPPGLPPKSKGRGVFYSAGYGLPNERHARRGEVRGRLRRAIKRRAREMAAPPAPPAAAAAAEDAEDAEDYKATEWMENEDGSLNVIAAMAMTEEEIEAYYLKKMMERQ